MTIIAFNNMKNWDATQHVELRQLFDEGKDLEQICQTMGRKPYAILQQLSQMQLISSLGSVTAWYRVEKEPWCIAQVAQMLHRQVVIPQQESK